MKLLFQHQDCIWDTFQTEIYNVRQLRIFRIVIIKNEPKPNNPS